VGTVATNSVQRSAASEMPSPPLSITPTDPNNLARLDKYLEALGAPLKMGNDASRIADALVSTMQSIVKERPDLATASFDFKSDNGALEVVSQDLGPADKQWLEGKLNANKALVAAVAKFHDDAVGGYTLWASADGNTLTKEQLAVVAQKADDLTGFLKLFSSLGADAATGMFSDGAYYAPNGARVSFDKDPRTAEGFLSFMQSAKTLAEGTAKWVAPDGHVFFGVLKGDIFPNHRVVPNFFPVEGSALGLSKMA
jgi:hypothetical protein